MIVTDTTDRSGSVGVVCTVCPRGAVRHGDENGETQALIPSDNRPVRHRVRFRSTGTEIVRAEASSPTSRTGHPSTDVRSVRYAGGYDMMGLATVGVPRGPTPESSQHGGRVLAPRINPAKRAVSSSSASRPACESRPRECSGSSARLRMVPNTIHRRRLEKWRPSRS